MKLLDSLLDAIVRLEGDALVMHVGEKPYVVTTSAAMNAYRGPLAWGQVELSSRVLSTEAVQSMLSQILPAEQHRVLDEIGAVEFGIDAPPGIGDRFTVVAARGGDDIWLELRRQPAVLVGQTHVVEAQPAVVGGTSSAEAATAAVGLREPPTIPDARQAPIREAGPEGPAHVSHVEPGAEVREPVGAAREVEERVPVLEEVGRHAPEHVEHLVISVSGREGSDEVQLDSVPGDAFELVDEVAQEVPSDSEVDALLAATGTALLTSGLGADVKLVEDDAQIVALESSALDLEEELSATLVELDQSSPHWSAVGFDAVESTSIVGMGSVAEEEPTHVEPPSDVPPATATPGMSDLLAGTHPPDAGEVAQAPPLPSPEPEAPPESPAVQPTAAEGAQPQPVELASVGPPVAPDEAQAVAVPPTSTEAAISPEPEAVCADTEAVAPESVVARVTEGAVVPEAAAAEPVPPVPELAEPATVEQGEKVGQGEKKDVEPALEEQQVTSGLSEEHVAGAALSETTVAASALPPPSTPEPRIPVSETLPELHGAPAAPPPTSYPDMRQGMVVPLSRPAGRTESAGGAATLQSALRTAATRGATTVYLVAQAKPVIRVNGEIVVLESEPVLSAADVEGLVAELSPPQRQSQGEQVEWMSDVSDVGRVRCLTFRDHRGPGVIFRMDHVGLPPEVRALCTQPDGLVVIAGPHASGKSTLVNAFVDQINVTRGDHVISLEPRIGFVHESRRSFISQREIGGDPARAAAAARAALREDPDVLVIEDAGSADLMAVALEAAESGRLVFVSVTAPSAVTAIAQLLEAVPVDQRGRAARSLASTLRGVVSQVLLRRTRGGRVPAREVLLNTPTVAAMIRDGRTTDLASVFESGRGHGLLSMTDALMALVREGAVQPAEAYRKASDRPALLGRLKQEGVDTTFADRLV